MILEFWVICDVIYLENCPYSARMRILDSEIFYSSEILIITKIMADCEIGKNFLPIVFGVLPGQSHGV